MFHERNETGALIARVPEYMENVRKALAGNLTQFWEGHAVAESVSAMLEKFATSEAFADISGMLAKRLTERIEMFVRIANGAIFGNFPNDLFWQAAWADSLCTPDDIIGRAVLICGSGYGVALTQDAEAAFQDATEAARYSDEVFRWHVGAIMNVGRVWLRGAPLITCKLDFDADAAKAWVDGRDAMDKLVLTVDSILRSHEAASGMTFADWDWGVKPVGP
eukprot:6806053-Pyramimonas_sp.AAC.1